MNSYFWSYMGIGIAVLALIAFPLWWMVANYKRRGKGRS